MKKAEKVNRQSGSKYSKRSKCLIITAFLEGFVGNPQSPLAYGGMPEAAFADEIKKASEESFVICADGGYKYAEALGIVPDLLVGDFDSFCDTDTKIPNAVEIIRVKAEKDDTDTGLCIREAIDRGFSCVSILGGIGGRLSHTIANIQNMAGFLGSMKMPKFLENIEMWDAYRRVIMLKSGDVIRLTTPPQARSQAQSPSLQPQPQAPPQSQTLLQSLPQSQGAFQQKSQPPFSQVRSQAQRPSLQPQPQAPPPRPLPQQQFSPSQAQRKCFLSLFSLSERCEGVCISGAKYPLENAELRSTFPLGVSNEFAEDTVEIKLTKGLMAVIIEY